MKKLVLSLAMAACLISGVNAAEVPAPDGTEGCYWSYTSGDCKDVNKFAHVLTNCKKSTVKNCLKTGCSMHNTFPLPAELNGLEPYIKDRCGSLAAPVQAQPQVQPQAQPQAQAPSASGQGVVPRRIVL
jgi:hypothetical protein